MARIALFADGTGNARTAQFRTNVWKLYDALEDRPDSGQIGFYHDGVGTSASAPLKVLGGVFGVGLGRNVRQLYAFLCRNHASPQDEIYLFGFSRGAFTARILAGLIACQGVRHITDEAELARWVDHAYRANRLRIALEQVGFIRGPLFRLIGWVRNLLRGNQTFAERQTFPDIKLVGVWDTVAAYGGPIVEMVRGFDRWVWPLSMPDYKLSPKVLAARHALSLDEEREAFLPLPWDEVTSVRPGRIRQVWFAGVHSDVGGGYADDGLSGIPLAWMLAEAKAQGLAFKPAAEAAIAASANAWGPMHDSRSGAATVYRYQPRSINALMGLTPDSPLRDPVSGDSRLIEEAVVHESVLKRIKDPDGYAPIVLPTTFADEGGSRYELPSDHREEVWGLVTRRRWFQWALLVTCAAALLSPLLPRPSVVAFVNQALSVPLAAALALVPLVPAWFKAGYAASGTYLIACAVLVLLWLRLGDRTRMAITRVSAAMWAQRATLAAGAVVAPSPSRDGRLLKLRRRSQRLLKWRAAPAVFGLGLYAVGLFTVVMGVSQFALLGREADRRICAGGERTGAVLSTLEPCHALDTPNGRPLQRGHAYRVDIAVRTAWQDDGIPTSPLGFGPITAVSARWATGPWWRAPASLAVFTLATAIRREPLAGWFTPVIAVREDGSRWLYKVPLSVTEGEDGTFHARFTAPSTGRAFIYVNDALGPGADARDTYQNNQGTASVEIVPNDRGRDDDAG